jgi:hypothetical protein
LSFCLSFFALVLVFSVFTPPAANFKGMSVLKIPPLPKKLTWEFSLPLFQNQIMTQRRTINLLLDSNPNRSIENDKKCVWNRTNQPSGQPRQQNVIPISRFKKSAKNRGRCYDHNFRRFLTIFGKKLAFFLKTNVMIKILHNLALFWVKNANFFRRFFWRKYLKNHSIGPCTRFFIFIHPDKYCLVNWQLALNFQ